MWKGTPLKRWALSDDPPIVPSHVHTTHQKTPAAAAKTRRRT